MADGDLTVRLLPDGWEPGEREGYRHDVEHRRYLPDDVAMPVILYAVARIAWTPL